MILQELLSDTAIKFYSLLSAFIVVPIYKTWKNFKNEKAELVNRVTSLEEKVDYNNTHLLQRMNTETEERKNMDRKLDTMMDVLTEVRINTAVNSANLKSKD